MNKFFIVGKCYNNQNTGPANVIRGMLTTFQKMGVNVEPVLLSENCSKSKFLTKLFKILLSEKQCVINVHTDGFLIVLLLYIMSLIDIKNHYYLTIHGIYSIDSAMSGHSKIRYRVLERILYKHFKNVICVSMMLRDDIIKMFRRKKAIYVIPNATDAMEKNIVKAAFTGEPIKIAMLGGVKNIKGIWESLNLVSYLLYNKNLAVNLDIYGGTDNQQIISQFKTRIKQLKIEDVVNYRGNIIDKDEVYKILAASDFQICLSKYDTFNVAIIESLILGCPCVSSNMCGAAYLIDNHENGLVIDLKSKNYQEEIYDFLKSFIEEPEKYSKIKKGTEKLYQKVSWEGICLSYLEHTKYLMGEGYYE